MGGQRVGEEKNELGFALDRCVWAFLFNRKERTTVRSNPTAWKAMASSKRVVGRVRLGYRSSGAERMPHRGATHAKQAVGRVKLRVKLVFLLFLLQITVFVQILSKFLIVFFIQIIPTKI
jgi:hypothetical protein